MKATDEPAGVRAKAARRCGAVPSAWPEGPEATRMDRSASEPTNVYSRRPVLVARSSGGRSIPAIATPVAFDIANETTSARWSVAGDPRCGVTMLTGPRFLTVGSGIVTGRGDVLADRATLQALATRISVANSFASLLHIELPHLVVVVDQPDRIMEVPSDRWPAS
jgi:hypothetical protein